MGISVPIGSGHYGKLKRISEKLGLGLKKSMECLISYYWQREMHQSAVTEVKPIRQFLQELNKEYDLFASDLVPPNSTPKQSSEMAANSEFESPSAIIHQDSDALTVDDKEILPSKTTIPLLEKMAKNCLGCGSPRRSRAKYCYNCGSKFVITMADDESREIAQYQQIINSLSSELARYKRELMP